jgi:hypothetical protein
LFVYTLFAIAAVVTTLVAVTAGTPILPDGEIRVVVRLAHYLCSVN